LIDRIYEALIDRIYEKPWSTIHDIRYALPCVTHAELATLAAVAFTVIDLVKDIDS